MRLRPFLSLAALLAAIAATPAPEPAFAQVGSIMGQQQQEEQPAVRSAPDAVDPAAPLPGQAEISAVEQYLNGIHTMKARFLQTANDGKSTTGDFYMKRPGRLRFEYDKPVKDLIVADGLQIHYYDGDMKQDSAAPISKSLADFFLRKNLKLSGDVRVSDLRRDNGLLYLTVVEAKDGLAGSLTLGFTENPLQLKKWRVVDGQGQVTEVELLDTQVGIDIDSELFHYYDPEAKNPRYNR